MSNLGNKAIMAKNILYYMEKANKTRNDVCQDLGISYTTFTDWVKGNTYPRIDKIEAMANYFGITKSDLVEEKPTTTSEDEVSRVVTLGEVIKQYRLDHHMSMDVFATRSGLSKGYISMLERNTNPRSGNPLVPSIDTYKNCAKAMGMTINDLFDLIDDNIDLSNKTQFNPTNGDVLIDGGVELMPTQKPQFSVAIDDDLLKAVDDYRFENRVKSQNQAINNLVRVGLEELKKSELKETEKASVSVESDTKAIKMIL